MAITASEFQRDMYRLLDEALDSGVPLEIEHRGRQLRIVPVDTTAKSARLDPHPGTITGDPQDLMSIDWTEEWRP